MPPDATGIEAVGLLPHTETFSLKNGGSFGGKSKKMTTETKVDVDKQLKVDRDVLTRRIMFRKATRPDKQEEEIRKKLMPLNKMGGAEMARKEGKKGEGEVKAKNENEEKQDDNEFRRPATVLYKKELVVQNMQWKGVGKVGAGLVNYGNTCFLNSVLQCLLHTPPLANYLLTTNHKDTCRMAKKKATCAICELQDVCRAVFSGKRSIRPVGIATHLKTWGKHFRKGRQEDAHEFLRYFMDAMQKSCLEGMDKKMDIRIQETTLIHQMFGGYLCSSVTCTECGYASKTYEAALDLSLEIARGAQTVEEALKKFTAKEKLDGNNKYKCEKCERKVVAVKQLQVLEAPLVLSLHLKRFDYLAFGGGKITKKIGFSEDLDLSPYMSKGGARYRLAGMIQHHGHSTHSGHYIAYVRAPAGQWYMMDDDEVHLVGAKSLLNAQAYMLFYLRTGTGSKPMSEISQKESNPRENGTVNRTPPTVKPAATGPTMIPAPKKSVKDMRNGNAAVSQKNGVEVKRKNGADEKEKTEKIREKKPGKLKVEDSAHQKWIIEKEDSDDESGKKKKESGNSEVSPVKKAKKRDRMGAFRVVGDDEDLGMAVDSSVAAEMREGTREDETGERKKKKKKKKVKTETGDEDTKEEPRDDPTEEPETKEERNEKRKEDAKEEVNENGVGDEERRVKKKKKKAKSESMETPEENRKRKSSDDEERIPKKSKIRESGDENQKPARLFESEWHDEETWKVERVKKSAASKAKFGGVLSAGMGDTQKFGENVKTWDGEQNMVDAVAVESRIFHRRHKDDVEIDKGRVKKVKAKKEERKPRYNVFQVAADKKRKGQGSNNARSYSPPPQV